MLTEVGHIGLNVKEIDRSTQFYRNVFGYELIGGSDNNEKQFVFLGKDGQVKLTLWQQSSEAFNNKISGLHHLAFQAESIEQVERVQQKLKEIGVKFIYDGIVPHAEGTPSGGIFFEDPDGIRLEIAVATGAEKYAAPTDAPSCGFF